MTRIDWHHQAGGSKEPCFALWFAPLAICTIPRSTTRGAQLLPQSSVGDDTARFGGIGLDFAPKPADINVWGSCVIQAGCYPNLLHQVHPRHHLVKVLHKNLKQVTFQRGKVIRPVRPYNLAMLYVEFYPIDTQRHTGRGSSPHATSPWLGYKVTSYMSSRPNRSSR